MTNEKRLIDGDMAFIATADMRTFHCPVTDIINKNGTQPQREEVSE